MSTRTLTMVALGVAWVGTIAVNIASYTTQKLHRGNDYCQVPFKILNENIKACQLLGGKPIKVLKLDLRDAKFKPTEAKLVVPVKGNKRLGLIFTLSKRPNKDSKWVLQYAVMKIKDGEKRWNVWLYPDNGIDSNTDMLPEDVQESLL